MIDEIVEETYKELFAEANKKIDHLTLQNEILDEALEKAIEMLDLLDDQVCFLDDRFTRKTKEEWKAWLFEDE